ncbi:MAG: AEC family transporter [Acutalibacteraceae bacterium]|nr:AEC family transporter [Acutalibacteraceae bacterium]
MLLIFSKVLVVFIYIGVGLIANRLKVLPEESVKHFISLVMGITVPCLVISSITGQDLNGDMYRNTILTLLLTTLVLIVTAFATTFVSDRIFPWKDQQDRNVLASAMTGCNAGFMGLPIASAVFGELVFYYLVIQNIANNLYLFVMSLAQLHHRESEKSSKSLSEKLKPLVNPTSVATIVSLIMLFAGIHLPEYAMDIVTTLGDITIPLSMILVGVQLGGADFKKLIADKALLITSVMKLIAVPALALLILTPMPVDPVVKLTVLLGMCFPSAVIGVAVAAQENKNPQLMAEAVAITTLLSLITLPVWIMIITRLYL